MGAVGHAVKYAVRKEELVTQPQLPEEGQGN
jgi:hypothetical protein